MKTQTSTILLPTLALLLTPALIEGQISGISRRVQERHANTGLRSNGRKLATTKSAKGATAAPIVEPDSIESEWIEADVEFIATSASMSLSMPAVEAPIELYSDTEVAVPVEEEAADETTAEETTTEETTEEETTSEAEEPAAEEESGEFREVAAMLKNGAVVKSTVLVGSIVGALVMLW